MAVTDEYWYLDNNLLALHFNLNMEAVLSSKKSINLYQITW
jgi:hypothetical protein